MTADLKRSEFATTVTEVVKVTGGTGVVRYRTPDGAEGRVSVIAEGWGDGYPSYWPPAVGDEIKITLQPVVIMTARKRPKGGVA